MSCFIFTFLVILWHTSKCVNTEDLLLLNFFYAVLCMSVSAADVELVAFDACDLVDGASA